MWIGLAAVPNSSKSAGTLAVALALAHGNGGRRTGEQHPSAGGTHHQGTLGSSGQGLITPFGPLDPLGQASRPSRPEVWGKLVGRDGQAELEPAENAP